MFKESEFKKNFIIQVIQSGWPLIVLITISFFHSKNAYADLALILNLGYLIGSVVDFGGVNHRILNYSAENYNDWLIILFIKVFLLCFMFLFYNPSVILFAFSVVINPLWIFTNENEQKKFINYVLIGRLISFPLLLTSNFIFNYALVQSIVFIILNVIYFKKKKLQLNFHFIPLLIKYFKSGFSFFLSKFSTSFWLYIPFIIISKSEYFSNNYAYLDKLYQLSLVSIIPVTLTMLKVNEKDKFSSHLNFINITVITCFVCIIVFNSFIGSIVSTYLILIIGMPYIGFLGHGMARSKKQLDLQNLSIFILTIIFGSLLYFFQNLMFMFVIIFVSINVLLRNYIIKRC